MIEIRTSALRESKPHEYLLRFLFGGLCSLLAGLVAKRYGPEIGGLFLAFPAIFPAGASLIESHERRKKRAIGKDGTLRGRMAAASDAAGAALGCVGLSLFGWTLWQLLPRLHSALCLVLASLVWLVITPGLWELRRRRFLARRCRGRSKVSG
ncbi:DUF3147 family protein [Pseudacidobacterium ailaaui]|jgi:hypothetical protein|uniref:DUF3147 family protein n=1 Tax=Pseudacidobacterium ailaaui TaxID=1382359 RepID=UPI0005D23DF5|nr:DUF3147 family protein [Pseudacidobacterium ailaaui]